MSDLSVVALSMAKNGQPRYKGNTINFCGDSIGGGMGWDTSFRGLNSNTWPNQFLMRTNGQLQHVWTSAVSGQTTEQILSRFDADVIARGAALVTIQCGTNDVGQGLPVVNALKNIEQMVKKSIAAGITPILCTIPPRNDGKITEVNQVNSGLFKMATKYGLDILDFYKLVVNPANGQWKAGLVQADGVHPNSAGIKAMGEFAAQELLPKLPVYRVNLPAINNGANNLIKNGLFLTDARGNGVADSWDMYGNGVATSSIVPGDDTIIGNWMQLEKTGSADTKTYLQQIPASAGFKVGDTIAITGRFKTEVEAGGNMPCLFQVLYQGQGGFTRPINNWLYNNNGVFYREFVIPTGTTRLDVTAVAGVGTGKFSLAQVAIYNLSNEVY